MSDESRMTIGKRLALGFGVVLAMMVVLTVVGINKVNYIDDTISDYKSAYWGKNASRLATVRQTYDPHGFFTQPQDF